MGFKIMTFVFILCVYVIKFWSCKNVMVVSGTKLDLVFTSDWVKIIEKKLIGNNMEK